MTGGDLDDGVTIPFSDFSRVDLRIGKVVEAFKVDGSEKLVKLIVDFGKLLGGEKKTIFTGLSQYYDAEYFKGKCFVFVYNLEPKRLMNEESQGMLLSVDSGNGPKPIEAPEGSTEGGKVR